MNQGTSLRLLLGVGLFCALSPARIQAVDLDIHGDVTTLIGWQKTDKDALNIGQGPRGLLGDQLADINNNPNEENLGIFLDQVEIDMGKQLGASFGWRFDLDVSPHRDNTGDGDNNDNRDGIDLEQAYIEGSPFFYKHYDPAKGGFKLAAGRFNAHVGYDPIDRKNLNTISFSSIHRFLLPHNISGGKATLFKERWSGETFVVQGIQNQDLNEKTISPSYGVNLKRDGWKQKSWLQLSGIAGPQEEAKGKWTYLADLAARWNLSSTSQFGLEGVYRIEKNGVCGNGKEDCVYYGGMIQFVQTLTDQLSGTLRSGYLRDQDNGGLTGASQTIWDGTVALSYSFMEVAKFVLEYRQDVQIPTGSIANRENAVVFGAGGLFVYEF